jgi:hypothetical protein
MGHKKFIIITTIYHPTEAVKMFSEMNDYQLVVVADKKTPVEWNCPNVVFLSVNDENNIWLLNKKLPFNHYSRKMLGYLFAIKNGATVIIDTDDDNIPKDNWRFPEFTGKFDCFGSQKGFVNIYNAFTDEPIWPRGLPLNLIKTTTDFNVVENKDTKIGVWQGLADEDPDVDAIYRLTSDKPVYFQNRNPIVLGNGVITPFNTQNTAVSNEIFPLLYLPVNVTFRFTDILRGLIAQPIMHANGFKLGFIEATVVQKRNPHDYLKDFESEMPMYRYCEDVVNIATKAATSNNSLTDNLYNVYDSLIKKDIVPPEELSTIGAWINDLDSI